MQTLDLYFKNETRVRWSYFLIDRSHEENGGRRMFYRLDRSNVNLCANVK